VTKRGEQNTKPQNTMTITKLHDGSLEISDIIGGYLIRKRYYLYSKKEAIALFRKETKQN
jgi:hypothetical protein